MASFDQAIVHIAEIEGGYVNHHADKGGPTNYGISLRFLKEIEPQATIDDIKNMSFSKAKQIYKEHFWDKNRLASIYNQSIAIKMLDMAVNFGQFRANVILQKSINVLGKTLLKVDGIIGNKTLEAVNEQNPNDLIVLLNGFCCDFYVDLYESNPSQATFLLGWFRRANKIREA